MEKTNAPPLKVWFVCTGVEIFNRGIETFFREAFNGLAPLLPSMGIHASLFKGGGSDVPPDEFRVWCLRRTGIPAKLLGKMLNRNAYTIEQMSFLPGLIHQIRRHRPDIIFYSDGNMAMRLWNWRDRIGVPFKLLYSNGAPLKAPFTKVDHVQQVVPCYYQQAMAAGESPSRHSLVPYGFAVPPGAPQMDPILRQALRRELGLPLHRQVVLSVGWIAKTLKRMDYTVNEIASMPHPRPYLVLLGAIDDQSPPIFKLAEEKLGAGNFAIRSVPPDEVNRYYESADVFVLSSLQEGFGRVYIEALISGLPVIAHDGPVTRFVLGDEGDFADLSLPGGLSAALIRRLQKPSGPTDTAARRESVRERFSWEKLAPAYAEMFRAAERG